MPKKFYTTQSTLTDPKEFSNYYHDLPDDVVILSDIIKNLILHRSDGVQLGYPIPPGRMQEINLRSVHAMLTRILILNPAALEKPRIPAERLIGSCREFALLMCSILRSKNIPARLRYGFSVLHIPGFHHDQVLLEYWHNIQKRWILVDVRMNEVAIQLYNLKVDFNPCDLPREFFVFSNDAWRACRLKEKNPEKFGALFPKRMSGWWYVRNKLMQDFAALNKHEMLLWDCWGFMLDDNSDSLLLEDLDQLKILDEMDFLMREENFDLSQVKKFYDDHEKLRCDGFVYCVNPVKNFL